MAERTEHKTEHESQPPPAKVGEDSDPDFDDLDDVLDQFSTNTTSAPSTSVIQTQPVPSSSGPGRPSTTAETAKPTFPDPLVPHGPKPDESEEAFLERLQSEMSKMFAQLPSDPEVAAKSPEDMAKIGKELEEFTLKMEEQGIKPEDLLKAILGQDEGTKVADMAHEVRDSKEANKAGAKTSAKGTKSTTTKQSTSFDDTIRRTMSRLNESDTQAKNATSQAANKSEEDMLAEMLKALDSGSGDGDDGVSKMFTDMMHQLTHKDMLYEPMKELNDQYPAWLKENKPPKTEKDEYARYEKQAAIVKEIVSKFEEKEYKDEDERCREYIWNHMQSMQELGAPPSQLVSSPFGPGTDFADIPGLGAGGADQEGCPTQ